MEQRRYPRYQLTTPLTGVVEQEGERYQGSVLNISAGGFYLHLPRLPQGNLKIHGADDYGEIHFASRSASGFGNLVRIEKFPNGVGIGFSWDRDGMDAGSSTLIGELIKEQEQKRAMGRVSKINDDVLIAGHISSAISHEVLNCLRSISPGKARLSLAECTSIDSSGIEMLMSLRDRGVPIVNINPEVESITLRFQLSTDSSGKNPSDAG